MIGGMRMVAIFFVTLFLPLLTYGAGLVPCGGPGETPCDDNICFAGALIDNVADWFVALAGIFVIFLIIRGGLQMVLSMGSVTAKADARRGISTAVFGYILVLMAWMLVDTFLKFFTLNPEWGVWNPFNCA